MILPSNRGVQWELYGNYMGIIWDIMGYTLSCHQTWRKKWGISWNFPAMEVSPWSRWLHFGHRYRNWVLVQCVQVSSDMYVYIYIYTVFIICMYIYIYIHVWGDSHHFQPIYENSLRRQARKAWAKNSSGPGTVVTNQLPEKLTPQN